MGDTSCASINAVLRACMPCIAQPASRRWYLADRVSESRAQPGFQIDVELGGVPARDSLGRIAHVRGIYVFATGEFTTAANNDAVSAYQLRSLFESIYMQDLSGHAFWPSISARDILDDNFYRHFARVQSPYLVTGTQGGARAPFVPTGTADYGIPTSVSGISQQQELSWYAPLVTLGPGMNPLAGLIPLAALQKQSNRGALRFRLASAVAGAPAGVTFDGVLNGQGAPGLDVWLDIVYLPVLAAGPTWVLESYTLPDSSGKLRRPEDTTEHVHIRYYPDDGTVGAFTGAALVNNLDIFSLEIAGFTEMPGFSFEDAQVRMMLNYGTERDGAIARANAAQDLPLFNSTSGDPETMALLTYRQRGQGAPAGDVVFKYGVMGQNPFVRYNHRTVSCNEQAHLEAVASAVGCDPCSKTVPTDAQGKPAVQGYTNGVMLVMDPRANGGVK